MSFEHSNMIQVTNKSFQGARHEERAWLSVSIILQYNGEGLKKILISNLEIEMS